MYKYNIVYDVREIKGFGYSAKNINDDQLMLFKLDNVYPLPNWQHLKEGVIKKVYIGVNELKLEDRINNFNNID